MTIRAWEQQPDEGAVGYENFLIYLRMERADRSLRSAYFIKQGWNPDDMTAANKPPGSWFADAKKYNWEERARAFDRDSDRKTLAALQRKRQKSLEEIADLGAKMRTRAMQGIQLLQTAKRTIGRDADGREVVILEVQLTPNDIARLAETGSKLEQLALGGPTERTQLSDDPESPIGGGSSLDSVKDALRMRIAAIRGAQEAAAQTAMPETRIPLDVDRSEPESPVEHDDDGAWTPVEGANTVRERKTVPESKAEVARRSAVVRAPVERSTKRRR